MRKTRLLAGMIAIGMFCASLTACGGSSANSGETTKNEEAKTQEEGTAEKASEDAGSKEPMEFNFAFVCWGYSDVLAQGYQSSLQAITDGLMTLEQPIKVNWEWVACTQDENLDVCESLCRKGVDAVITIRLNTAMVDVFNENETLFGCYTVFPDEVEEYAMQSPYWVGTIHEKKVDATIDGLQALLDQGCKEIALMGPAPGNEQHDKMWPIWYEMLEEYPDIIVHEYKGEDRNEAMKNFISLYPNLDGVCDTAGSAGYGEATVAAIRSEGKVGQIAYQTVSVFEDTEAALQDGILIFTADGTHASPTHIFVMLLNRLMGTPLSEKPEIVDWPYVYIESVEDYENYVKYAYDEKYPMIAFQEYEPYFKWLNPEATFEDFYELADTLTLDKIIERHADFIG
ncbi:sugar ABC transporter substrate-binding protein [Ruminococcus gauvreauii]|uniref:Sugar ABC transporter substrate-binding protein n=1 Tax=Ruminococcus gauvreauii TaxID=438033 RepID=A0ABY5VDI4_9FIRM|nr:sugar ABC transporter substrate-binding protein [Ruminococcus gauvreauii]UWP58301.1 sugar ABC transporter substrate-binding protein [Ruminococcus gauvreauii]